MTKASKPYKNQLTQSFFNQLTRSAGVLMHITSLPGNFGTGDFGPMAYAFVDFLKKSGHTVWQVLPFAELKAKTGWSPYSATSAFAGNILFISPERLVNDGLISKEDTKKWKIKNTSKADYSRATNIKLQASRLAWLNFKKGGFSEVRRQFISFCEKEKYWLLDYALFSLFSSLFGDNWQKWPEGIKNRDNREMSVLKTKYRSEIELTKFRQFIFYRQWKELKDYANTNGILIAGDLPIYVVYKNADVWANPHFFKLDSNKKMSGVAGVPPDYFSKTGQLWNMPVYNWDNMAADNFRWWIQRISKNLELFNILRIDHFRGFSAYWEVPAGSRTAKHGKWHSAPGYKLFAVIKKAFPQMPFIAEDLGNIDKKVYELRDKFGLPGMKVLQFAFGNNMPFSVHIPHNYPVNSVAYTGTHDNNTMRGWFEDESTPQDRKNMRLYAGIKLNKNNCHMAAMRLLYSSHAKLVIIPIQDLLGLGTDARMNIPAGKGKHWLWKMENFDKLVKVENDIKELLHIFNR